MLDQFTNGQVCEVFVDRTDDGRIIHVTLDIKTVDGEHRALTFYGGWGEDTNLCVRIDGQYVPPGEITC